MRLVETAHASPILFEAQSSGIRGQDGQITAYEHAQKAGLIGAVQGTSRNLSANAGHFDGVMTLEGSHCNFRVATI